ncbi:helix-turn-helix domain-containing protein [Cysteiniphilum halobium]|uniref:helix-turn-helix domain-containing protein n=1 Tax=Cysteiniphilum halobium TaxID=2219059 RepID=UPI003F84119D
MNLDLKQLRKDNKLTLQAVADKLGVTKATVFKWESSDVNIKSSYIFKLASLYNVSPDLLISTPIKENEKIVTLPYKMVPLLYPEKDINILDKLNKELISMKNKKIICPFECSDECFVIEHQGEGMLREDGSGINPGALIFCDPKQSYQTNDIVFAHIYNVDEYVCLQYIHQYGQQMLIPYNKRYPLVKENFTVIGKVIAQLNKL